MSNKKQAQASVPPEDPPIEGHIVDEKSGEQIPRGASEIMVMPEVELDFSKVGTLEVPADALEKLMKPFDETEVEIRPDGLVYFPWTWYTKRLNDAFGMFQWALIPQGKPILKDQGNSTLIMWGHWLIVKSSPIAFAMGECSYYPSNYTMSYADAIEGAKSSSMVRLCKNLNIGNVLLLWDQEWTKEWKTKYAETYQEKGKTKWRKKKIKSLSPEDKLAIGRGKLFDEVKEFYPTKKDLADAVTKLKLTYSLEKHDEIKDTLLKEAQKKK